MTEANRIMKLCCANEKNREILVIKKGNPIMVHGKPWMAVETKSRCKVCDLKHYSIGPEPIAVGMKVLKRLKS